MAHLASTAVDTEGVANNFASWVQPLSIGDNALDGDAHMMVMALIFLVFGVVIFLLLMINCFRRSSCVGGAEVHFMISQTMLDFWSNIQVQ
jgi:hypothetical protein